MSKIWNNVRGTLVFALAVSVIAPQVASAKGGGGGSSHGGSGPRMSVRMSTPSFQPMKSFSGGSNFGSTQNLGKFNQVTINSSSTKPFKSGLSNVNAIRMTDRFSNQVNSNSTTVLHNSGISGKLPGVKILDRSGNTKVNTPIKLGDAIKTGPKFNPGLVDKINPKSNDPGKGGPKPIDPGKGNGQMPDKKFCKPFCKWPWWPVQIGWFPYGCYPYGYPYGGYRFGCYNTVSYINASATPVIDLALVDVRLVEPATVAAGPAYRVTFRNAGNAAAGSFRVAIFGSLDGELSEELRSVADVSGLAAGATSSVTLRLPVSAMHLTSASGDQSVLFKLLTVALDVENVVPESVKDNNAATLERASFEAR